MSGGDWKALFQASQEGDLDLIKYYLDAGIDPNYQHPEFLTTPLIESIRCGHVAVARYLLERGANPGLTELMGGETPLSMARSTRNPEAVALISASLREQEVAQAGRRWAESLDATTHDFQREFGALTPAQLNWKPDVKTWSIAQNIDHLIVVNSTYFPVIESIRRGNYSLPFPAKMGFLVSFMGKSILKGVQPGSGSKVKTFPIWEPGHSQIPEGILERFGAQQAAVKKMMDDASDLIRQGAVISSPANRYIVYKLETAFDIIVAHERRHLAQAKAVFDRLLSQGENHGL